jgi:hypothetical protein
MRWFRLGLAVAGPFARRRLNSSAELPSHSPLIEPDGRVQRIRPSDKVSRFRSWEPPRPRAQVDRSQHSRVSSDLRVRAGHRRYHGGSAGFDRSRGGPFTPPRCPATAAFPALRPGRRPRHPFRGLLDVHSRYGLPARPATGIARCLEGSGGFVTSTAAPTATGRSDPDAGWQLHPLKIDDFHDAPQRLDYDCTCLSTRYVSFKIVRHYSASGPGTGGPRRPPRPRCTARRSR